jgi:hypothetical protein
MTALVGFNPTAAAPEVASSQRRKLAALQGWPEGALDECEKLDGEAPDWWTTYRMATERLGLNLPEGFYAERKNGPSGRPAYAPTADALLARLKAWPAPSPPGA